MKKTASVLLFVILVFSAFVPAFAQNARKAGRVPVVKDEFVQFERIEAISQGQGVFIRWTMASETNNLGFYVYRNGEKGLELVNPMMIPGSAVSGAKRVTGREYDTIDADGTLNSTYVIEGRALDGPISATGSFAVRYSADTEAQAGRPLSQPGFSGQNNSRVERHTPSLTPELQGIVDANLRTPDINTHRWVVGRPGAKIGVRKDGFYRVSRAQLVTAGFDVNSPLVNWRLFMEGNEQAIIVDAGGQFIEFYGKGIDTVESDTRIYYLITGEVEGLRIQNRIIRPIGGTVVSNNYPVTNENKERLFYDKNVNNGDAENFFGRLITETPPAPNNQINFTLTGIDFSVTQAVISLRLQGLLGATHTVRAVLNGTEIGTVGGVGNVNYAGDIAINTSLLVEGNNTLALNETILGAASYFDTVSVKFTRKYQAEAGKISYPTPGYKKVDVTGFASPNMRVFDTTYDGIPSLITGLTVLQVGSTFTARIPSARPMTMYALDDSALLTSPTVTANTPSAHFADNTSGRFVIISHGAPDFMAAAEEWATYRRSQAGGSFTAKVIDIADVFDEYNYGVLSADSINAFLEDVGDRWQSQYVLLLGDSSYDSRNYEGFGYFNTMPSKIRNLIYDEAPSDDAMADFDGDGLPEIAIGRISARSGSTVTTMLNKTMGFETREGQSFDRGALFASDLPNSFDFEAMNIILANELPPAMPRTFVRRGMPPPNQTVQDPAAQTNLINAMNTGKYIVNYAGHGSPGMWASISFFSNNNVPQLTNENRQSIFIMLTCGNGYFIRTRDSDACLAERLTRHQQGGAVAAWASSTETTPDFQLIMGTRFFNQLAAGNHVRIGDLTKDAKTTLPGSSDLRYSWVLLGDPALKVIYTGDQ